MILAAEMADIANSMGSKTRLSLITSISKELLDHTFPGKLHETEEIKWDPSSKAAICAKQLRLGDFVLSETSTDAEPSTYCEEILAAQIDKGTIRLNKWNDKVNFWIRRVRKCSELYPEKELIRYSEEEIKIVYMEMSAGLTRASQVRDLDCLPYVKNLLSWDEQCFIEQAVPENIILPDGKKLRIFYEEGREVYTRAFIQQLFELKTTPLIGPARIPLTFEILAPNHRPIQVTKSLENFWSKLYPKIKPALSRRYHKHKWI